MDDLEENLIPYSEVQTIYFGPHWGSRFLHRARRIETPLGRECFLCDESIEENDQGLVKATARLGDDGKPYGAIEPVHAECDLYGFIGHQVGVCICNGHEFSRNTARLAWQRARLEGLHP